MRIPLDPMDQMSQQLERRPCQGLPGSVALAGCDVSYQSDLVRVDNLSVVDMWSPDEDHVWGALDEGCNPACNSNAWGELAEAKASWLSLPLDWGEVSKNKWASETN